MVAAGRFVNTEFVLRTSSAEIQFMVPAFTMNGRCISVPDDSMVDWQVVASTSGAGPLNLAPLRHTNVPVMVNGSEPRRLPRLSLITCGSASGAPVLRETSAVLLQISVPP